MRKSKSVNSTKVNSRRGGESQPKDLQDLEKIFELMEKHEITEFEWERKGERFRFKTKQASPDTIPSGFASHSAGGHLSPSHQHSQRSETPLKPAEPLRAPPVLSTQKQIVSPFVGTFYRSASPESDPYVREGQSVKRGDVLCIVEAMKLMNEIEAELSGKIVSVLIENGQPVEFGEPLFIIEP